MIDIHSHILPGIDDGARNLSEALTMLQMAVDSGVTTQVLTPHIDRARYGNNRDNLVHSFMCFKEHVDAKNLPIKLLLAAELRIAPEIMRMVMTDEVPCLGTYQGQKTFLLEFPRGDIPFGSENLVKWLLARDYLPIIVHPERNSHFLAQRKKLQAFVDLGCHLQITACSLTGKFGAEVQCMAEQLLVARQVSAIASDCHNTKGRSPDLAQGFERALSILSKHEAEDLVTLMPNALTHENAFH